MGISANSTKGKKRPPTPSTIENALNGFSDASVLGFGQGKVVILIPLLSCEKLLIIALFIKDTMAGQLSWPLKEKKDELPVALYQAVYFT